MQGKERVIAEIDLDAIAYNIQNIRKKTDSNAKLMGVVKADAYGHGAAPIAKALLEQGVDAFAVAEIEEGIALRKAGIETMVLLLGYTPEERFPEVISYGLTQTVFSKAQGKLVAESAKHLGKKASVHIKIDTGMGRLGFFPTEEGMQDILEVSKLPGIEITGMFTHFAAADEADKTFTQMQYQKFRWAVDTLAAYGLQIPILHAANSAGIMDCEGLCLTMARPGIILYGIYPSDEVDRTGLDLKPAMSLKSCISMVKTVPKGTPIGYGRTYYTEQESRIGTVPVGYADGFFRGYGKGGRVLVLGKSAPIVGRICMDQLMIDLTDIPEAKEGDGVLLFGREGQEELPVTEVAKRMDTIPYEVICGISKRVPRIYIRGGVRVDTIKYQ